MVGDLVRILQDGLGNLYSAYQANLGEIPVRTEETNLVYDSETKVIYYAIRRRKYTGYMGPYISEKGKFCRFIDNKIVEIV